MSLSIFTKNSQEKSKSGFRIGDILEQKFQNIATKKNYSKDYQYFGLWLAQKLNVTKEIPLIIKLAKTQDRLLLEHAISYISDYPNARSKFHLFLWFLKGKLEKMPKSEGNKINKKKKLQKNKQVELIGKKYESLKRNTSPIQSKIEQIFIEQKIKNPILITNPKEYLFNNLKKTKKYSDLKINFYQDIYKFDLFSPSSSIYIDIIDERDKSLSKKSYFLSKKNYALSKRMKYRLIDAEKITTKYSQVLRELIN
jgi:hypothetical protein